MFLKFSSSSSSATLAQRIRTQAQVLAQLVRICRISLLPNHQKIFHMYRNRLLVEFCPYPCGGAIWARVTVKSTTPEPQLSWLSGRYMIMPFWSCLVPVRSCWIVAFKHQQMQNTKILPDCQLHSSRHHNCFVKLHTSLVHGIRCMPILNIQR
jgi:hypothetical protein